MIISGSEDCVNCARQHYDIIERVEACRKKQEVCLEDLKCLNKESTIALPSGLKLLWSLFC